MTWQNYVLDVTLADEGGPHCFVPIEGDPAGEYTLVLGMNYLSDRPPQGGKLVGVVHLDGQDACDRWCAEHEDELRRLAGQ